MSGNNKGWFWTVDRLQLLRQVLNQAAKRDADGFYLGPTPLQAYVVHNAARVGLNVDRTLAKHGLEILVFVGVLEPGRPGRKLPGYRRGYTPSVMVGLSEADILRFRESQGVRSPLPPRRR